MHRNWFENPEAAGLFAGSIWSQCEDQIVAFERAWQSSGAPRIDDFLAAAGPARRELLIELVHIDLEFRLKNSHLQGGEPARVNAYFEKHPELAGDRRTALELIAAEYELRQRFDDDVSLDEYRTRFPDYANDLCERLRIHQMETRTPTDRSATTGPLPWPMVPGYDIVDEIGRGGMGVVYKARESSLGRDVALKFLPGEFAQDPDRLERFLREAHTASSLNHPHICVVHALGKHDERPFIVMEFIEGETLHAHLERSPSLDDVARWIGQAAQALATAHEAGVVHRDIKPENMMVRRDGYVKVLDFGLARRLPTLAQPDAGQASGGRASDPGAIFGTVGYMSPEQAYGQPADSAADIFSLGIVLYQLATGRHPFQAESALGTLHAIATSQPAPPSQLNPEIPAALDGLTEAMLQKDPRLRPTAADVVRTLAALAAPGAPNTAPATTPRPVVHREPELAALAAALEQADAGRGTLVCVAGEPGIGKTTLVEDFLASPAVAARNCLIARGQCSERLGSAEAYMPVMDALQDLSRGAAGDAVRRLMKAVGPTWYVQLATAHRDSTDREAPATVSAVTRASSQQALLREFRTMLEEVSRLGPVIFFIDDIHWADLSTVDLLAHLGRHCERMRVLMIVTYRPTELLLGPHPFHGVKLELQSRGACREVSLAFLKRGDVERYLALAFPDHALPADFAALIHSRTEGNPLFVVDLLRYLRDHGFLAEAQERWSLAREIPELLQELPGSVRSMIQRKLQFLGDADRRLLGAASVQGPEFDSAIVAATLALDAAEVDERLSELDRVHGLVRAVREDEFPDRTLRLRYAFVHGLYQQAIYATLPPTRRAALAAGLAAALEGHYGPRSGEAAAELACLYEVGRDFARAARHFWLAAQNGARVFAHREAVESARRGLRLLESLPETPARRDLELSLQTTLGLQLQVTEGFAAPEARTAYRRARALCEQVADRTRLFPVVWGLWLFSKVRSELPKAQEMADELSALALELHDPDLALQTHQAQGMTAFCRGAPAAAVHHVEQAAAVYDPVRHQSHSFSFGQDPAILCKGFGAVALWLQGYPEQAVRQSDATLHASRTMSPSSQAVALHFAAMLHQLCRDGQRTLELSAQGAALATEQGFAFWLAGANIFHGWALTATGAPVEGLEQLRRGLIGWQTTDSVTYQTYFLGLLAEVLGALGQVHEASRLLDEALELARQTGEGLYEAELHRYRGEMLLRLGVGADVERRARAEAELRRAADLARVQGAKMLELRATMSLARLLRAQNQATEAREPLAQALRQFTEGWDTTDLREAKALLAELA